MAKKPPSQLQRIIMAADPKKAKEAIEFIKKQIAQGGGTPEQKKVMAEIDSLKTDADKLAAYVTAKEEGRLEYDYKPQKGDVPRAAQEPWTKRDQRFYEGKAAEFNEPLTEEDFIRNRAPEPEVNKTRINYDDVAPGEPSASTVKQQGIPTIKAKEAVLKGIAGQPESSATQQKPIKEQLLEREARNAKLKAEREAARSGVKETIGKPSLSNKEILERQERYMAAKGESEAAKSGIKETISKPVEIVSEPEAPKAAEPETPKQTKSKKGSRGKSKTTQAQADEAALSKMAGKAPVVEAPKVSEPVATDPRAKALGISDAELDERLERARKIASGETPVEDTPKAAEPETPKETKSKGFKKTKEATAKSKTPKPVVVEEAPSVSAPKTSVVEPTPSVASEPKLPEEPTVAEAETQAKTMRERFAQPAVEAKPTAAPETVKQSSRTTMDADVAYQMTPEGQLYRTGSEAPKPSVTTSRSPKYQVSPEGSLSGPGIIGDKIKSISGNVFMDSAPQQSSLPLDQSTRFGAGINEPEFITARGSSAGGEARLARPLGDEGISLSSGGAVESSKPIRYNVTPEGGITPTSEGFQPESSRSLTKYGLIDEEVKAAAAASSGLKESAKAIAQKAAPYVRTVNKALPYVGAALEVPQIASDIQDKDYSTAAKHATGAVGSFAGATAGAEIGAGLGALTSPVTGPFGPIVGGLGGAIAGGLYGREPAEKAFQYLNRYGQIVPRSEQDKFAESIEKLEQLRDTAKTPEEKEQLEEVLRRTKAKMSGQSDEKIYLSSPSRYKTETIPTTEQDKTEAQTYTRPKELVESEKKAAKGLRSDDLIADFIGQAESRGDYKAVNKNSGAFGKYQILEKDLSGKDVHGKMVESRYGEPFKQAMADPEKQEDYFRNVLLPNYKIKAAELAKTPEAQKMGLDEFTLIGMLQLGAGNVRKYLAGNANENISKQMEYFKDKADKYKRSIGDEQAAILGLKDKEQQIQEEGRYIPYKSAQAKMDTARLGQVINRKDMDDLNARSEMYQTYQKADPFVSRMSPSQRRLQESETLTSDSFTPEQIRAAAVSDSDEVPTQEQATAKLATAPTEQVKAAVEKPITTAEPTIAPTRQRSRLEEALELQRQYEMMAGISRGAERLGRGLAGAISKVAPSKMSGGEFEESLTRMGKTGVEGAKLLDEEAIKQEESDPTSEKSKRARESLKSILGTDLPESLSYNDIKTLKFSDLSLKTGKIETQKQAEKVKRTDRLRKVATSKDVGFEDFRQATKTLNTISNLKPDAYSDVIRTLQGTKLFQGDTSVAREPEIRAFQNAVGILQSLKNEVDKARGVGSLQPEQRKKIQQAISVLYNSSKKTYLDNVNSVALSAQREGLPLDEIFDEETSNYFVKRFSGEEDQKEQLKPKIHPQSGIELYD